MADINLSVIADILLKGGKVDSRDVDRVIDSYLRKMQLDDLVLEPDVRLGKGVRKQFRDAAKALEAIALGEFKNVESAVQKAGASFVDLPREQAAALSKMFSDFDTLLSTPRRSKFSKEFLGQMNQVAAGTKDYFKVLSEIPAKDKARFKADVNEYITLAQEAAKNVGRLSSRANSLSKATKFTAVTSDGEAGLVNGVAAPLLTPSVQAMAKRTSDFARLLKQNTDEQALLKAAHVEAMAENARFDKERAAAAERSQKEAETANRKYIESERSRARARRKAREEADRALQKATPAAIGQDLLNKSPYGLRDLYSAPQQNLPLIAETLKSKIAATQDQLNRFKQSDAYDAQSVKARRLVKQIEYLNSKLAETRALQGQRDTGFVGPLDNPAYRNLQARLAYGEEVIKNAGGLRGVTNIPRAQLPLARETLQTQLSNLKDMERGIDVTTAAGKKQFNELTGRIQQTSDALAKVEQRQRGFGTATQQTGALMRQFFRYAIGYGALYQALAAVRALVGGVVELDAALKSIQAVTGSTDSAMRVIEASIKRVALVTKFSTGEIAKAAQVLAQAGTKPDQFTGALSSVALFASATETSIEVAADLVSTMRNVYKELDDLTIANQLTKAVNISKLTADDLKTILSRGAQVAQSYNIVSEQFLAAVAVLRNAGIKASTVATGLRQGLIELLSPDEKTLKVLVKRYKELGENLTKEQVKGRFFSFSQENNPLVSVLQEYKRIGFSGAAKADFERIFDVRAANAIEALIKNIDQLAEAETQLTFGNSALSASQTQMESLTNSVKNLGAAITVLADGLSGDLVEGLENVADAATAVIEELTNLDSKMKASNGVGLSTALGAGIVSGGLAAITSGGGAASKAARFVGGAAVGAGGAYAGLQGADQVDAGEGASKAAAYATGIGAAVIVFDFFGGLAKKAVDLVRGGKKATTGINLISSAILNLGVMFEKIKFKGIATLLMRGAAHPVIAGILAITGIIALIDAFFSKDTLDQAKAKLKQAQENFIKNQVDNQTTEDSLSEFRLSTPGQAAKEGSTAKSVEDFRRDITDFTAAADDLLKAKAEDFAKVNELLIRLGTEGSEAGSEVRKLLVDELQELATVPIGDTPENDRLLSNLGVTAAALQSKANAFRDSIRTKVVSIRETEGDLLLVDEAFLHAYQEVTKDSQAFAELHGMVNVTPQRAEELATALLTHITKYANNSDKAKKAVEQKTASEKEVINNAVAVIVNSKGPNEAYEQVRLLLDGAENLSEATVGLLGKLKQALQDAENNLGKKGGPSFFARIFGNDELSDLEFSRWSLENPDIKSDTVNQHRLKFFQAVRDRKEEEHNRRAATDQYGNALPFRFEYQDRLDEAKRIANTEAGRRAAEESEKAIRRGIAAANKAEQSAVETRRAALLKEIESPEFQEQLAGMPAEQRRLIAEFQSGNAPLTEPDKAKDRQGYIVRTQLFSDVDRMLSGFVQRQGELKKELASIAPENLDDRKKIFDLEEEIKILKKTNPNAAKAKIIEQRDLKVKGFDALAEFYDKQAEEADKPGAEKSALKSAQDARINALRAASEAQGEIDQINLDQSKKKIDNNQKLIALQTQEIDRQIKLALETGDIGELQRLDKERIDLMRQSFDLARQEMAAAGAKADVIEQQKKVHDGILASAEEEAADATRVVAAIKAKLATLTRSPTTGDPSKDAAKRAGGVPYSLKDQRTSLDINIAAHQGALDAINKAKASLPDTENGLAQLRDYEAQAREVQETLEDLKYQRDNLESDIATELSQGFNVENLKDGIDSLDSRIGNLGETINKRGVQGFDDMAGAIANAAVQGQNMFSALRTAAASALQDISAMIIRSGILKMFSMFFGGFFSGGGVVEGKANGGVIKAAKGYVGGIIKGRGTGLSDSIPGMVVDAKGRPTRGIRVSNKEAIITAKAVSSMGEDFINFANENPEEAGRMIRAAQSTPLRRASGGMVKSAAATASKASPSQGGSGSVQYTYSSEVNVEGNGQQSPQDLSALSVMLDGKIKQVLVEQQRPGGLLNRPR